MSGAVSHGRGGAANIGPDTTPYTDGEITREGPVGDQGEGNYSSGRGGAGNVGLEDSPGEEIGDEDVVPEVATREKKDENFHSGRGGAGNAVHVDDLKTVSSHGFDKKVPHDSLKDKIKEVFHKG